MSGHIIHRCGKILPFLNQEVTKLLRKSSKWRNNNNEKKTSLLREIIQKNHKMDKANWDTMDKQELEDYAGKIVVLDTWA